MPGLRHQALHALLLRDPVDKARAARELFETVQAQPEALMRAAYEAVHPTPEVLTALPGRPERPRLASAKEVPTRSPFTLEGRAALLHAICHIEFNAINLALDAVWRFEGMPGDFYRDWLQVASEEALHFTLLNEHLHSLGARYGDFDAHDGLWSMCERTAHDILARMALVPRTLEARGLDATPPIQAKLTKAGDLVAVGILDIILRDEIGHVAIGNRWFHHLCAARGLDPVTVYPELVRRHEAPRLKPPYNLAARKQAGFSDAEMRFLLGEMG
ncbi:MAG TPA: ferritin-like domain-containing protein [Aquabacterium sp.]|uniref:ferritin-like domain-containing protein n=1 Tax=Aquabacterium sp. TaxID=1872578 RepID=UPI002E30DD3F|nr:ferritin-like domain-containing protein [Aquabacterium sp.]HEX5371862.1 ferritin-like domain-containing protein [Aquabacterium sp.]